MYICDYQICCVTCPGCFIVGFITFLILDSKKYHFYVHIVHQIWFSIAIHQINCFYCDLVTVLAHNKGANENCLKRQLKHQKTPYGNALWWQKSIILITFIISGSMCIHPQSFITIGEL